MSTNTKRLEGEADHFTPRAADQSYVGISTEQRQAAVQPAAFKLPEACQYLGGVSPMTVRRLIKRGVFKPCSGFRHILIPRVQLDNFLAGQN